MTRIASRLAAVLPAALLLAVPLTAAAQQAAAQQAAPGLAAAAQTVQSSSGPLIVEPIRSAFVIAPDVKVTDLDNDTRTLVGGYAGWLAEDTLLLGAGGYWLADHSADRSMAYGGFVVQWTLPIGRSVRVGARTLLGAGQARLSRTVTYSVPAGFGPHNAMKPWRDGDAAITAVTGRARYDMEFLVAEPQADLALRIAPWLSVNLGAGYRAVANADGFERQLRGAVGSFSIRVGRSS